MSKERHRTERGTYAPGVTTEEHDLMVSRYRTGESIHQIGRTMGYAFQTVSKHLKRAGIECRERSLATRMGNSVNPGSRRTYTCNYGFFDKIDTESKAYWMGFLAADGTVCDSGMVALNINIKDIDYLNKYKRDIEATHPIYRRSQPNKDGTTRHSCSLFIQSFQLRDALTSHGVVPRKTRNL